MRRPHEIFALKGPDGIDDVFAKLQHGPLATDTETTGLDWRVDRVGGICLAAGHTAVFAYKNALEPTIRWLADQVKRRRELVFHHGKFDMHMLYGTFGLNVPYPVHDTMLQSHLLDNRGAPGFGRYAGHGLKPLARAYVDPYAEDAEKDLLRSIRHAGGKTKGDWMLAEEHFYVKYSALDPWYTLQLHLQFVERLKGWAQPPDEGGYPSLWSLYENEQWLLLALRDMERRGIRVDLQFLHTWERELAAQKEQALSKLHKIAKRRDINWNSVPQLRRLLYGSTREGGLGIRAESDSTDKTALTRMGHPIGAALLNYRRIVKQHGTFALGLIDAAAGGDTIHCHFNQNVDTGRMSCSAPNLQQQDRNSGVRRGFIPRKGLELRFADYSQIEMRIAADIANESMLVHGFCTNPEFDMHTATAMLMFGTTTPTKEQRSRAKTQNFAVLYGAGEDNTTEGLMNTLTYKQAMDSCREMGHRPGPGESPWRTLAQLLKEAYNRTMPSMRAASRRCEERARKRGFAMNRFGRHRYLSSEETYKAFNTEDQGGAADLGKRGLVAMYRELQLGTGEIAMLLQVHDEVIYETAGDPQTDMRVLECLNDYQSYRIPIVAEISGSKVSWQDKQKVHLACQPKPKKVA